MIVGYWIRVLGMQKEQFFVLMDGEMLDSELFNELVYNLEMQKIWESYYLICDLMWGDIFEVFYFDIFLCVMVVIEEELVC